MTPYSTDPLLIVPCVCDLARGATAREPITRTRLCVCVRGGAAAVCVCVPIGGSAVCVSMGGLQCVCVCVRVCVCVGGWVGGCVCVWGG